MSSFVRVGTLRDGMLALAAGLLIGPGCAHHKQDLASDAIKSDAPFSRTYAGSGDTVCWSVKRALLSQGYMLDRPNDSGVLTGTRDFQPQPKLSVTVRLQATCADNKDGTSIVFATAVREDNRLQKMKQSSSVGIGPATLTMPSGSAEVLGTVRRETVQDPDFYARFFTLVQGFIEQERLAEAGRSNAHPDERSAKSGN